MAQTIGVVLAGGEGSRMGRLKGEIVLGDASLAERAARALSPICASVLVSVARGTPNPAPSYSVVEDDVPGRRGPLAGIAAAFGATGRADLLVLACDYPGVTTALLRAVRDAGWPGLDLVFPADPAGRDHPLVALWRRSAEPRVRQALDAGEYKVQALFPDLELKRLRSAELLGHDLARELRNVNWPADLEAFEDPA